MLLTGENRSQLQMMCLEESVALNSYVRVVDAFVDYLNISSLGFVEKGKSNEGRPDFTRNYIENVKRSWSTRLVPLNEDGDTTVPCSKRSRKYPENSELFLPCIIFVGR